MASSTNLYQYCSFEINGTFNIYSYSACTRVASDGRRVDLRIKRCERWNNQTAAGCSLSAVL
jgi:hypothetical protein